MHTFQKEHFDEKNNFYNEKIILQNDEHDYIIDLDVIDQARLRWKEIIILANMLYILANMLV